MRTLTTVVAAALAALSLYAAPAFAGGGIAGNNGGISGNANGGCTTNCTLGGTTVTSGITDSGGISTTAATGFKHQGLNAYRITTPSANNNHTMAIGPYAANTAGAQSQFLDAIGPYAAESTAVTTALELVTVGNGSAISQTTGGGVALGTGACSSEMGTSCFALGADSMRDYYEATDLGSMAIGNGALGDGTAGAFDLAIGPNVLWGSASSITVGAGTPHAGDVITLSIATSNACNGTTITVNCTTNNNVLGTVGATWPATVAYTVVSGDTTATILAGHLATAFTGGDNVNYILGDGAIEGNHNLYTMAWQVPDASNHPTVLKGHYPGNWFLTPTVSCTGTCNNTFTVGTGYTGGHNVLVGNKYFVSPLVTNPQYNTMMGDSGPSNFVTNASSNSFFGYGIANNLSNGGGNGVFGANAGAALTTGSRNNLVGEYAGTDVTTGNGNHVFADQALAGSTCITTGSDNMELGEGACVPTATASNQISIQNLIYATGASTTGSTVGTGLVGIANSGPTATLTVGDGAGSATQGNHIAFVNTTQPALTSCGGGSPALDATGSDVAGTITEGSSATGCVLTFNKAFATAPHCTVSSSTGLASLTWTISTTLLTISNSSTSSGKVSYICTQ